MRIVLALLIALSLAIAALALAADDPSAYGMAQRGSFKVVSNVLFGPTGGEMKGVWLDGKRGCLDPCTLRVSIQIDLVSSAGKTTRIKRSRQGAVDNCAEGGPNFGFNLMPKAYKMACSNGRWSPAATPSRRGRSTSVRASPLGEPLPPGDQTLLRARFEMKL